MFFFHNRMMAKSKSSHKNVIFLRYLRWPNQNNDFKMAPKQVLNHDKNVFFLRLSIVPQPQHNVGSSQWHLYMWCFFHLLKLSNR